MLKKSWGFSTISVGGGFPGTSCAKDLGVCGPRGATPGSLVAGGDDGDGYVVMDGGTWSRSSEEAAGVRGRSFEKGIH